MFRDLSSPFKDVFSHVLLPAVGEPTHGAEDCGTVSPSHLEFGDFSCYSMGPYICEKSGECLDAERLGYQLG